MRDCMHESLGHTAVVYHFLNLAATDCLSCLARFFLLLFWSCSCLRRMARGEPVLDPATGKTTMLAAEYAAVLDHLQGEKDRLAAATAAANTSSSSSATNQKQQLHHLRDAVGLGQQQQKAGGSSGGGRGHGKTTGLERHNPQQQQPSQQQQRAGMQTNGSLRQSQAGPDQHPAPHAAAAMAGIPPIAEQVPGSASTNCSRQGGAGGAAVGALVAAAAVTAPSQQEQADVAGTTSRSGPMGSLPDGQEQQQGPHSSSRWVDVVDGISILLLWQVAELTECSGCLAPLHNIHHVV
jgi:hypothetical protein